MEHTAERPVVVGIDDRPDVEPALQWAVADAISRPAPLRVVTAFRWALPERWTDQYVDVHDPEADHLRHVADSLVASTVERVGGAAPALTVAGAAVEGAPVGVLLAESKRAAAVVLGSRHHHAFGSTVLGSVGAAVAARGECPVIVVRGQAGDPVWGAQVVVGLDGGDGAEALLDYAFDHADRRHVPLLAVLCWHPDLLASMQWRPERPPPKRVEQWLTDSCAGWREKHPDVEVHTAVLHEHPVVGLANQAAGANLLVVGTRGRHALAGTLLGSVSQGVLHHATCPVAVIPTHH